MSTPTRLAGFAGAAAVVFLVSFLVGRSTDLDLAGSVGHAGPMHGMDVSTELPGGLATEQDGYRLVLAATTLPPSRVAPVEFRIIGRDGRAVSAFDVRHGKQLHLIAVRRDLTGFQHVHPTLTDGTWRTDLALAPGAWRLFADFAPTGHDALTLGADLMVPGAFTPAPQAIETRVSEVVGYRVSLTGDLVAGATATLRVGVSGAGGPVEDLEPYLTAYGHLVALRSGDLAYLHVHPDGMPGDGKTASGPEVVFDVEVPSAGTYHLFFDFQHRGEVRTAAFVVTVAASPGDSSQPGSGNEHNDH